MKGKPGAKPDRQNGRKNKHGIKVTNSLKKAPENPFDKFANARKKHEVVNRRVKGEDRNVGRALARAVEERKQRLLIDYQTSRKSNTFNDKRFGESDASMSLEDKMFMRFQKERMKRARNSTIFNLDSNEDADVLTHKGNKLSDLNYGENDWSSDEEDGGALGKEVVSNLHFGGGMVQKLSNQHDENGDAFAPKNRMDALQEIVAKSKLHKIEKKEAKLEQEDERSKLDAAFQDLIGASMLEFKPTGRDRSEDDDEGDKGAFGDYDVSLRAMAFEAKVQPSDRTKSPEELALEERARIEKLEAARLRRMSSSYDPDLDEADSALVKKGREGRGGRDKGKKGGAKRARTDDDIDDDFDEKYADINSDDDEDVDDDADGNESENDDEDEDDEDDDDDDDEEEGEEEEDDEDDWEDDEDGVVDKDDDNEERKEATGDEEVADEPVKSSNKKSSTPGTEKESESMPLAPAAEGGAVAAEGGAAAAEGGRGRGGGAKAASASKANDRMPHKLECPADLEALDELVRRYVRHGPDLRELIDRIVAWNSVHLPGAEGAANRGRMHNFMDVLLKHFIRVGDSLAVAKAEDWVEVTTQLDHLTKVVFKLSTDMPDAVAPLWGRTLKIMLSQLQKRLRDSAQGAAQSCWPSLGRLLLLRLLGHVFAVTDYRHAIVGPATLLLCQCLAQCPVSTARDVASGLLSVSVLLSFTAETKRVVPECHSFVHSVACLFVANDTAGAGKGKKDKQQKQHGGAAVGLLTHRKFGLQMQKTFSVSSLDWLRGAAAAATATATASPDISSKSVGGEENAVGEPEDGDSASRGAARDGIISWHCFGKRGESARAGDDGDAAALSFLRVTQRLAGELVTRYTALDAAGHSACPELLEPLVGVLRALRPQDSPSLPLEAQEAHADLLEVLTTRCASARAQRRPLRWRVVGKQSIETKNPRFEVEYRMKKDTDGDASKVKLKQLGRQLKREQKAAMRELRRDSDFLEQEKFREQLEAKEKLREQRNKNFAWMEEQQATINEQVRKGGGLLKGGGTAAFKPKKRVKR